MFDGRQQQQQSWSSRDDEGSTIIFITKFPKSTDITNQMKMTMMIFHLVEPMRVQSVEFLYQHSSHWIHGIK